MGDPKVKLTAAIFEQGQNEGIERAVLPLPQLSYLQNARMRKNGRIGKRFGYSTAIATGFSGVTSGPPRCVGGSLESSFAIVGDRCFTRAQLATNVGYVLPSDTDSTASTGGSISHRIPGAVSGWLPDTSFFPVPNKLLKNQTSTPCASCYAFGCLWTAMQYTDPANATDKLIRVVATDVADQTLVRVDEFSAATAGFGGVTHPKFALCGGTLVLTYLSNAAGGQSILGRNRTVAGATWSATTSIHGPTGISSHDASPFSATQFLVVFGSAAGAGIVSLVNATTLVRAVDAGLADSSGNPVTTVSVVGSAAAGVYVGYGVPATPAAKVRSLNAVTLATVGTATLSTAPDGIKPLLCLAPASGVRVVHSAIVNGATDAAAFRYVNVSAAAALSATITQRCFYPISSPFTVGLNVYLWAVVDTGGPRYATLLRLPDPATDIQANAGIAPLEMSVQDLLLSSAAIDLNGVPAVAQIASTAAYAVPVPTLYAVGSTIATGHDFRILQAKNYTDSAQYRSLQSLFVDRSSFVPCGNLTRVDDRGAVEEGFVHPPVIRTPVPAAGGALTASSDYYYAAIYKSRNSNGRFEVSGVLDPVKATMGVGQTQNTLSIVSLGTTQRTAVSIELYRTLHDDKTFYLAAILDSDILSGALSGPGGTIVYVDQLADTAIATQQALYIQVGQQLSNSFPPSSRFGCAGGGRLFLGGLMRPDVVHASKLILGDQSPSFADSDAFRVVLPSSCTGVAWCDSLVLFTAEGIYIAPGEGPDDSGIGDFGGLVRLPFALGCIEPRSVFACDDGVFFQTSRGLYLLPRGFGVPQAVDLVMSTLATYPVICGVAALVKATEQTVRWVCVNATNQGAQLVYDLVHKVWSVDLLSDAGALGTPAAQYGIGNWYGGELAMFTSSQSDGVAIKLTNSLFGDDASAITMLARTGDVRPFGPTEQGNVQRLSTMLELRSACTLSVAKTTDRGVAHTATRVYTAVGPDTIAGELSTLLTDLGNTEQRSVSALRIELSESSTTEGVALIALALENGAPEGARLNKPADRIV